MKIEKASFLLVASVLAAGEWGCDDHPANEGGHQTDFPACTAIVEACHAKDQGVGPVGECHSIAHGATSEAPCLPKKDECVRICNAADAGAAEADGG